MLQVLSSAFMLDLQARAVQPLNLQMTPQYLDNGKATSLFQDMFYSSIPRGGVSSTQQMSNNLVFLGKTDTSGTWQDVDHVHVAPAGYLLTTCFMSTVPAN
jgi:hypothetical protein